MEVDERNFDSVTFDAESVEETGLKSRNSKYSEIELKNVSLSEVEESTVPYNITNPWYQLYYGFIYAFKGVYYVFKHELYKYMIIEGSLCVTFFALSIAISVITSLFTLGTTLSIIIPVSIWIFDIILQYFIGRGMERTSYIEEHRMKGSEYEFGLCSGVEDGEEGCSCHEFCCVNCQNLFADICMKIVRQFIFLVLLPIVSFFLVGALFPIGSIFYILFIGYLYALNFGFSSLESGFLSRRYKTFFECLSWAWKHHNLVLGYGIASMILYCVPVIQVIFYLFCSIGGTRLVLHLEEERKLKKCINVKAENLLDDDNVF